LRILSKLLVGVTATATAGVMGMAGTAAAQSTHIAATAAAAPAGVVTGVSLACPKGGKPTSIKSTPAQPKSVNAVQGNTGYTLAGVWGSSGNPPPPPPGPFAITVTCSNGTASFTLTIGIAPAPTDIVGVGSDTIQNVMDQFSSDFNKTAGSGSHLYSWDATNPELAPPNNVGDPIVIKGTSSDVKTCEQPRPDGSSAGITALESSNPKIGSSPCIDFARSSRARGSTDPNSISFVNLAGDAVGYATEPAAGGAASNVPTNLTTAELASIYECKITNWNQLPGGKSGKPEIFIPQTSSGTRSFFLSAIGVSAPGTCANDLPTTAEPGGTLEENEGVNKAFTKNPQDVIFPYSIGKWLAEAEHSAKCFNTTCTAATSGAHKGQVCTPAKGQNLFGCDTHGTMALQEVNSTKPTTPFPPTKASVINSGFSPTFQRLLFEVVPNPNTTGFGIPANLQPLFGPTGFTCTNSAAKTDLKNYGFLGLPNGTSPGDCGFAQ
jgi:ABC-type phosphate transport system substrate-binding protein